MTAQDNRLLALIRRLRKSHPELKIGKLAAIQQSKFIKTMGIRKVIPSDKLPAKRNAFVLEYDLRFVRKHTDQMLRGVLMHEFMHIKLDHLGRFKQMLKYLNGPSVFDIFCDAADLEANELIHVKLPKGARYPGVGQFRTLPSWRTAEEYFVMILTDKLALPAERMGVRRRLAATPP